MVCLRSRQRLREVPKKRETRRDDLPSQLSWSPTGTIRAASRLPVGPLDRPQRGSIPPPSTEGERSVCCRPATTIARLERQGKHAR